MSLPVTAPPLPSLGPALDRNPGLDAARGFAILGLIFCNIPGFASAEQYRALAGLVTPQNGGPDIGEFLVEFLLAGKCVAMLSFLLGAGMALQHQRATAAGQDFAKLTARRMGALFVIGLLHIVFLWWGDILCAYAILGFGLLLLHRLSSAAQRGIAVAGIGGSIVVAAAVTLLMPNGEPADKEFAADLGKYFRIAEEAYRNGTFSQILLVRMIEALVMQILTLFMIPMYLGVVLLGFDAMRSGWFPWRDKAIRPTVIGSLAVAGAGLSGLAASATVTDPDGDGTLLIFFLAGIPGTFALAGAYLWGLLRFPDGRLRRTLAAVGRTALSNYLLQSFCGAVIFQAWGFGLYGQLNNSQTLLVAAGIVILQIAWPALWLRHFRFGPMEYLWRLMAYGRAAGPLKQPSVQ